MTRLSLRVDGKYTLAEWDEEYGFPPVIRFPPLWSEGLLLLGDDPVMVGKWIKCYRGKRLLWTAKVGCPIKPVRT